MKICYITYTFSPYNKGGADIYTENIAKYMAKIGHEVVVIACKPTFDEFSIKEEIRDKIKIYWFYPLNVASFYEIGRKNKFLQVIWRVLDVWNPHSYYIVKKILKKERPDVVHTNTPSGFSPSIFNAVKSLNIPLVHTLHDYYLICPRITLLHSNGEICETPSIFCKFYQWINEKLIAHPDTLISPSEFTLKKHKEYDLFVESQSLAIPNGIELNNYNFEYHDENKNSFDILYVGVLAKHKGIDILVNAIKKIKNKNINLHICGDGEYKEKIEDMVKKDRRITVYGRVSDEHLDELYKKADVFVLPSIWYENFPVTIQESFRAGIPVIASDIGGVPELIKDGYNGFLFEAGNLRELRRILEKLINDPYNLRKMKKNAFKSVKKYNMRNHVTKLEKIYFELKKG